ncbi:hypothetical protein K469DRAFT_543962 [Zopfia rhizophila CBS 207.26]|uniref:DUF6594 domain-containing protein n=1 Tax=Zopfia rhizophila CBS 207.26 TaxID=1314779 RepID=A0A6A6ESC3_9PEZI|nr:hypothetical protein K469DRAFT_543962 [Zopfia rhizophila CBS 207.26]
MSNGYARLASLMGLHPEIAILRRFGALNAQNLLYLQAELTHLEHRLQKCVEEDADSGHPDRTIYDRDWQTLSESGAAPDGNPEQWNTILLIRKRLEEYNQALLFQTFIAKCDAPNPQDLKFLRLWMKTPRMGNVYLLGPDSDVYEKPQLATDLIALKCRENQSLASRVLGDFAVHWWHRAFGWRFRKPDSSSSHANTVYYSQETILRLSTLVGTVFASVLPVVAIVVLYYVTSMIHRLAIIGVFTGLFSAALGILTTGRVVEIFSATAA